MPRCQSVRVRVRLRVSSGVNYFRVSSGVNSQLVRVSSLARVRVSSLASLRAKVPLADESRAVARCAELTRHGAVCPVRVRVRARVRVRVRV